MQTISDAESILFFYHFVLGIYAYFGAMIETMEKKKIGQKMHCPHTDPYKYVRIFMYIIAVVPI